MRFSAGVVDLTQHRTALGVVHLRGDPPGRRNVLLHARLVQLVWAVAAEVEQIDRFILAVSVLRRLTVGINWSVYDRR